MVTIITTLTLKQGAERDWDAAMRDRMAGAEKQPGWIGGQLLKPERQPDKRLIVGTWRSREYWKKWHADPRFEETRRRLEGLVAEPEEHVWHVGVIDARQRRAASNAQAKQGRGDQRDRGTRGRAAGARESTGKAPGGGSRGRTARGQSARRGRKGRAQGGRPSLPGRRRR